MSDAIPESISEPLALPIFKVNDPVIFCGRQWFVAQAHPVAGDPTHTQRLHLAMIHLSTGPVYATNIRNSDVTKCG